MARPSKRTKNNDDKRTRYKDLTIDIWQTIMVLVVQSDDGERSLARARPVCRIFKEAADSKPVLEAAKFKNEYPSEYSNSFWKSTNGLLNRCMRAGNVAALDFTLMVITYRLTKIRQKTIYLDQAIEYFVRAGEAFVAARTRARTRTLLLVVADVHRRMIAIEQDRWEIAGLRLMYRTSCRF